VTHHFPTKSGLLQAVLSRRDEDAASHLLGRRGVDLLRGLLAIAERDEKDRGLSQLFAILSAEATIEDHPAHEYFRDRFELVLNTIRTAFLEAQEDGDLRPGVDPIEAALTYEALANGLQLQRLYGVDEISQTTLSRRFLESVVVSLDSPL
jgi:AcrR family transcriptional regulator